MDKALYPPHYPPRNTLIPTTPHHEPPLPSTLSLTALEVNKGIMKRIFEILVNFCGKAERLASGRDAWLESGHRVPLINAHLL